jgi:aminopeptidase
MRDPRNALLAHVVIHHSTQLQPGEVLYLDAYDIDDGLVEDLVDATFAVGGIPVVQLRRSPLQRSLLMNATEAQLDLHAEIDLMMLQRSHAYVGLRAWDNVSYLADVPGDRIALHARRYQKPVHSDYRVNHTRWVVLRYPTPAMAQLARMSTAAFEEFYYRVCTLDYSRMARAVAPLAERMRATDQVHIVGPGTDLRFSIKGIGAVPCEGRRNLPDGECFSAPVRDSVEGTIAYNAPSLYQGTTFNNVRLSFEAGCIVHADGDPAPRLREILASDEGASHVGEFSLAFNPFVLTPIGDTLFDEKIAGSLHFTPGQAYELADNGNRSQIHWDLVLIQRPEYGGGEIWFDGELIRKDGRFVVPELEGLNPEHLTAPEEWS